MNRKCDRGAIRRMMLIALALTATVASAGCGMTGGKMLYFLGYGRGKKIPEQFTLPPGKLLVLVDDPQSLVRWPQAREMLAEQTAREILRHEAADHVISNRTLLSARQADPEFERRSAQAIGKRAGADTVVVLSIQDFEASDQLEETTSAARMSVAVKVIDVNETESPTRVRLWPQHGDGHIETVSMPATKVHALKSERAIAQALTQALGRNVARLFYEHTYGDVEDDEF